MKRLGLNQLSSGGAADGNRLTYNATTGCWEPAAASTGSGLTDPTTMKGDLLARNSTAVDRLPVGTDGQVLTADSTQTLGVKWAAASGGGTASVWSAKISDPLASMSTLTTISGTWTAASGIVQQTATTQAEGRALNRSAPQGAMGYSQVDVRLDTDGGGANTRIGMDIFAPNSTSGGGTVIYLQKSGTNWNLVVECTGTAVITTIASVAPYATGTWYTLAAAHTAGGIEVYFNGTFMCLAAAQPNRSGNAPYVGLYSYGCATSFRNLKTWGIASPTSGVSGGSSGPIAYTSYKNAANYTTSSTSFVQADSTNLSVTFTAPSSGRVLVELTALSAGPTSPNYGLWTLFESGTAITGAERQFLNSTGGIIMPATTKHVITGLTSGSSHTYTWGWRVSAGGATMYASVDPVVMLVYALP